jgi:hypothetical protein
MVVTFNSGIFKNDFAESCPWFVRIHSAVAVEENPEVGISRSINVRYNMMVNKRLVIAISAQANEGAPCCIFAFDELYNVMGWKLLRHKNCVGEARCTVFLQFNP